MTNPGTNSVCPHARLILCAVSLLYFSLSSAAAETPARVTGLKTEHVTEPLGLETPRPRFGWLFESSERGQLQTAYQILVASTPEKLETNIADKWDSGKVQSDNSVEVTYAGSELASAERAFWKVRIWDRQGRASAWSAPSFFEMGLRRASDWQGKWIAAQQDVSAPLLRRELTIDSPIRRARVYVSGIGYYELSINGRKVGDRVLEPASTYYHNDQSFKLASRVFYSTYDVTQALQQGANAIGVMLGHGWYSGEADAPFRTTYGDRPRLIFQMNVELADGRRVSVISDSSWKTSAGPITYNDLAHGETYDARLEQPGWDAAGFDDASWQNAVAVDAPNGVLSAQLIPPSRVVKTLPAIKRFLAKEPEGVFFKDAYTYDFGQNFTGWVRIKVSGPKGAKLIFRYGARLDPEDDTLDNRSNSTWVAGARQMDTYILKGEGTEIWEPRFTLHGFRYVEVRGFRPEPSVQSIEGRVVRSDVESTGTFSSSNDLLNRIHRNIDWTLSGSFQGFPQDAAERAEREGWLGDPGFVAEDYIHNYDVSAFWEKWLEDIRDNQREDGSIPIMSPMHLRGEEGDSYEAWPSWQSTYPLFVWYLYQYYGDRHVLEEHYAGLKKLVDFHHRAAASDHLIPGEDLGDHMEPQPEGYSALASRHTPNALTANAYFYLNTWIVAQVADVLGQTKEARAYQTRADVIKTAFNKRFFDPVTKQYATGSQTSNALPIYLGIVPVRHEPHVLENLIADIEKHDNHVTTGIIGSNAVVQVLPQRGAGELMYELATQTTYPSLGHQVMKGATTVCETYECGPWISQNMKMLVSLDKFFYRNLAGISPASPGYRRVRIQPQPVGDLRTIAASQKTVRGPIDVQWKKEPASFDLQVSIAPGMEADIVIPNLGMQSPQITEGGKPVWKSNAFVRGTPGLSAARADAGSVVFQAGSGSYHFIVSGASN